MYNAFCSISALDRSLADAAQVAPGAGLQGLEVTAHPPHLVIERADLSATPRRASRRYCAMEEKLAADAAFVRRRWRSGEIGLEPTSEQGKGGPQAFVDSFERAGRKLADRIGELGTIERSHLMA